jgi:hypothetical protein
VSRCSKRRAGNAQLFDDFVGAGEQGRWHLKPDRLGGLEIDEKLEFGRSRKLGDQCTLKGWGNDREPHYVRPRRSAHRGGSVSDQPDGLAPSFHHLVGTHEERGGHLDTERLRGLQIQ